MAKTQVAKTQVAKTQVATDRNRSIQAGPGLPARMTRRRLLLAASSLAGVGLLAACAPSAPTTVATRPPSDAAAAKPTQAAPAQSAPAQASPAAQAGAGASASPAGAASPVAGARPAPAVKTGGEPDSRPFVFAARLETATLDPNFNDGSYFRIPSASMYEPLVEHAVSPEGKSIIVPVLAEKWEISPDGKTYTFTLRKNVQFHDGSPFNAEAVKWTYDRLLAQKTPVTTRIAALDSVQVVDPGVVRFQLKTPMGAFLAGLTRPLIISPSAGQHEQNGDMGKAWLDTTSAGTGAYKLEQWSRGQQISVVKFPNYWRGWEGNHVERVVVRIVKEPATQRQLLETGDAHMVNGIAFDDLSAIENMPGIAVQRENYLGVLNIGMHTQKPPFNNLKARQAVAYTFDYDGYLSGVFGGRAKQPLGPLPTGSWALDESLKPFKRDVARAKQLASEAGIAPGTKVRIVTISPFGWYQPRQAQILQQNLKELGMDATIDDKPDSAAFVAQLSDKEGGPNFFFYESGYVVDDPDPDLRRLYYSKSTGQAGRNGMWYDNPKFDELLDKALATSERAERKGMYDEIQKMLVDDVPVIWPAQLDYFITRRDTVRNYIWQPLSQGIPNFYDLWIAK